MIDPWYRSKWLPLSALQQVGIHDVLELIQSLRGGDDGQQDATLFIGEITEGWWLVALLGWLDIFSSLASFLGDFCSESGKSWILGCPTCLTGRHWPAWCGSACQ